MTDLNELLKKGYFPKELPPPFVSISFADLINLNSTSVPEASSKNSMASEHNIARVGSLRRKLSIPNPFNQFELCNEIVHNWPSLNSVLSSADLSKSKPAVIPESKRALSYMCRPATLPNLRAKNRMNAKYILTTDITDFYHSIYTHSIPWALHGKVVAKADKSQRLLGNRLDRLLRNGQDSQTIGVPIGPDTSVLLSEILLAAVDESLAQRLGSLNGFRYVDDYELCFSERSKAENALNQIELLLSDYELSPNPHKTKIYKLPLPLDDSWANELNRFQFRESKVKEQGDLIAYFGRAFELAEKNPRASILRYAITKFRSLRVDSENWPLLQALLLQCISSEPGTLPHIFEILVRFSKDRYSIKDDWLENILNTQIQYHAPLNHGSEVAWSLCAAIAFNIPLHAETASIVSHVNDSVVALLALDAEKRSLFSSTLDKNEWNNYMTTKSLYEEHWLLSYEANVKGWLSSKSCSDHVDGDPFFRWLKANNVSFYDTDLASATIPDATLPMGGGFWSFNYE